MTGSFLSKAKRIRPDTASAAGAFIIQVQDGRLQKGFGNGRAKLRKLLYQPGREKANSGPTRPGDKKHFFKAMRGKASPALSYALQDTAKPPIRAAVVADT